MKSELELKNKIKEIYQLSKNKDGSVSFTGSKKIDSSELNSDKFKEDGDYLWTTRKPEDSDKGSDGKIKDWQKYRESKDNFDTMPEGEKFSKEYESFAEGVKSDIKKNKDVANYYLEIIQKDIKQSGQRIKSIKKEAQGSGSDFTGAISKFEERIKDASILSKQIKEITGEYKTDQINY